MLPKNREEVRGVSKKERIRLHEFDINDTVRLNFRVESKQFDGCVGKIFIRQGPVYGVRILFRGQHKVVYTEKNNMTHVEKEA